MSCPNGGIPCTDELQNPEFWCKAGLAGKKSEMDEIKGIARAFYWTLALVLTLVGSMLTYLYHLSPFLLLLGAVMLLFGAWKVRSLGFEGAVLLGFMLLILALWFSPLVFTFFVYLFEG